MTLPERRTTALGGGGHGGESLADILERVLDKGIVVAGDIKVNVLDIELLTLKVRLLVASVDTARDMGIDWWRRDPFLTGDGDLERENRQLRDRVDRLERALDAAPEHNRLDAAPPAVSDGVADRAGDTADRGGRPPYDGDRAGSGRRSGGVPDRGARGPAVSGSEGSP